MSKKVTDKIIMENCSPNQMLFRNFSGRPDKFNPEGNRNFTLAIDDKELASRLSEDGWNVRTLPPYNDTSDERDILKVAVNFNNIPPKIVRVTNTSQVVLDEDTVSELDVVDIKSFDVSVSPYNWEVNGKSGVKAYLKTLYVVVEEDDFASKYNQFDDDLPFK